MKKALKITGITALVILIILVFLLLSPMLFREKFEKIIKNTANKELKTEMNFSDLNVSFFRHFPNLTITLSDFSLRSSAPFATDTLVKARDISFGLSLGSIFSGPIKITKVYLNRGRVIIQYNDHGEPNYDVYYASSDTTEKADTTTQPASIQIEHIYFIKTDFIYADPTIPLKVVAHGINYHGTSKVKEDIFRLTSNVRIDSVDLIYNGVRYIRSQPVKAKLTTAINTNSLDMKFEKNDLYIQDVPFDFKGEFSFRPNGYSLFISLFSQYKDEYLSGSVHLVSDKNLWVSAKADVNIDLHKWAEGFGIKDYEVEGHFTMKLKALGEYISAPETNGGSAIPEILSIPQFNLSAQLDKGSFHLASLPESVKDISFDLKAACKNNDYRSITVQLENFKAGFLGNKINGYLRVNGLIDYPIESRFNTKINLAEIRKVIPLDSLDLQGLLDLQLDVKGKYAPEKKLFPVADVTLSLTDGAVQTKYYPRPVKNINVSGKIRNTTGEISDTRINIDTVSFTFEDNSFGLKAQLQDPGNLAYDIAAKGSIDVAKIYRLFSQEGMELNGFISMDLALKGHQSDAMAGRYEKLDNKGRFELRDIGFSSEYLPLPFIIKDGVFLVQNDNIRFQKFHSRYGQSDITLDGRLSNVVNYLLADNQPLKGNFTLHAGFLLLDEFMSTTEESADTTAVLQQDSITPPSGVIVLPKNLQLALNADVRKLRFQGLDVTNLKTTVELKQGLLLLKAMDFDLIGCNVAMDATYGSINPSRAFFDFHVKADHFDVKKAYQEVELFRNLSPAAGKCEGIVSLDYSLKGKLDEGMNPVYPSLEGSGVITLEKVKVMGLKLFTSLSKNLEKEKIKNPDLSKVEIRSSIRNNVITLEKTKMKMAGFRLRVSGETNFNGSLNLKARLGLPPLGIIGIPIHVTGTQKNPKFRYGRGATSEEVEETEYTDELSPEMLQMIRNAKEEELEEENK